jgi:hypothetical protein
MNMPFELGLAYAIKIQNGNHKLLVMEKVERRLDRTLSDLKGIDPKIHHGTVEGAVSAILESIERPGRNPTTAQVMRVYRLMNKYLPALKKAQHKDDLYNNQVFIGLVTYGWACAEALGI